MSRHAADLFIVKEGGQTHIGVVLETLGLDQGLNRAVGHFQIIETGRKDEFVACTADGSTLESDESLCSLMDLYSLAIPGYQREPAQNHGFETLFQHSGYV